MQRSSAALAALGLAVGVLTGCADPAAPPDLQTPPPTAAASSPLTVEDDQEVLMEEATKRAESGAERTPLTIDWAAARADRALSLLDEPGQKRVDAIPMPVLLPDQEALVKTAFVTSGPGWYSAAMHHDGVHVRVIGQSAAFKRPELVDELGAEADPTALRVSASDHIFTAAFARYGVYYSLDVECERAAADPRCANPEHVRAVAADLVVMGGAP